MARAVAISLAAPLRQWWSGVLLAVATAATVSTCSVTPAAAQVRTHGEGGGSYSISVMSWRDIPFRSTVRQQFDYSCGSAAVATLLRYHYGVTIPETEVFQSMFERGDQARIREVGFSMLDMRGYLERRGFQADGLRLSLDRLATLNVPAIALITHNGYRHFVVVKGVNATHVLVGDPTFGLQTYTRADFEAVWNGVALAVRRTPENSEAPRYNDASEWRPWAVAPVGDVDGPMSPSDLARALPELYQVTDVVVAN